MNSKKIYIILMHTKSLPSRFVKLVTRYEYSHVGISLTKDCDEIYSFGRRSLRNVLNGGFVKEGRNGRFFNKFDKTVCKVYELSVNEQEYIKIKKELFFMEGNAQKYKYDFLGAVLRTFRMHISFEDKYICSTFVANVLEQSGAYKFEKELCFIKPIDFENMKGAKEVYIGKYNNQFCLK